ncbi:kunitz-type protease inhibitor 1 isoform X5 [Bos javanicus]|uniref:kunitz-type protease inhibitor 1 isoform X5 n=1 Tax=Bos javanicus TaxID=9906 RepID=UPI002AA757AC|nr:kunitz-type protease inhibitor 1 isoform X5 [Bos javanicus]
MAGGRLSRARIPAVAVWLLCALVLQGAEAGPPPVTPGLLTADGCLNRFTPGVPDFVLDTDASVRNGATFLRSLTARRGRDCVHACCSSNDCNLALVELQPDGGEDAIVSCFLINCLYEQNFVCKFAPREGFINYLTREVYRSYRELRTQGFRGSRIPMAWDGIDLKVQPQEPLVLKGVENTDWRLLQGDTDIRVERNDPDQVELWGLKEGSYLFQLTATGSDQPERTSNVTVTVLSPEQTEGPSAERHHPVCSGSCHSSKFRCADGCCIDSFLECDDTPDCPDASDEATCEKYTRDFDKLQRIHFPGDKGHCVDMPDTGLCSESIPRWYYNPFTEHCARFTYGGCYGNKNNFEEEEQCLESCRGISKKDVFGLRRESPVPNTGSLPPPGPVEVAIAVLLGTCIVVVVAILGYCFFKNQRKDFHRHRHPPPSTPTSSKVSTTDDMEHLVYYQTTRPL